MQGLSCKLVAEMSRCFFRVPWQPKQNFCFVGVCGWSSTQRRSVEVGWFCPDEDLWIHAT
jgi:hypothetical protein